MDRILTIIIPMYNSANTIKKCLDSVIEIDNIEIILVDDGSTDNTRKICLNYVNKFPNVKYIYQENKGPGSARNLGINNSQGIYIMFIDSDDYIETKNLKELIQNFLTLDLYDLIYYNFDQVLESGKIYNVYKLQNYKDKNNKELIKNTISWRLPWGQFKIIKKEILSKNGINFDEEINNSEELFFTIHVLEKSHNIYFFDKIIYHYLKRENSLSTGTNIKNSESILNYVKERLEREFKGQEYDGSIYNYVIISKIHILKLLAECKEQYSFFKEKCKNIRSNKNKVDSSYLGSRYKIILILIYNHMDFLLYSILRLYFRRRKWN